MKRKILQLLSAAAMGGVTAIITDPQQVSAFVPPKYQPVVGVGLGILSMVLPSILPQKVRTKLWGSVPTPPAS